MRRVVAGVAAGLIAVALIVSGVTAAAPVDVRGTWDGSAVTTIGSFRNIVTFTTEDFTTGSVTGTANSATYTVKGSVSGSIATFDSATKGYSSHSIGTVSADGKTMTGTFSDTNGRKGTFLFARTTPVPNPSSTATTAAAPTATPSATPASACTFGGFGGGPAPVATSTDPLVVARVGGTADTMPSPGGIVSDSSDPRGRVFVTNLTAGTLSVIDGRPLNSADIHVESRIQVGRFPDGVAIDPATGHVFVALGADCRVAEVDGRAATPAVLADSPELPGNPSLLAYDQKSGRLFVAIDGAPELLVLRPNLTLEETIALPGPVTALAIDPVRDRLYAGTVSAGTAGGGGAGGSLGGSVSSIDAAGATPAVVGGTISASDPTAIVPDPLGGNLFVVEAGARTISTLSAAGDVLTRTSRVAIDPPPAGSGGQPSPSGASGAAFVPDLGGRSSASAAVFLPGRQSLLVPLQGRAAALIYDIGAGGTLTIAADLEGIRGGTDITLDPVTGRAFVSEVSANEVAVLLVDGPVAPAPSIAEVVPGPFDISLAPTDVARSVGIMLFLMLLLGAPTPIFNSTLSANRKLIERWVRRRRPRWMRSRGPLSAAGSGIKRFSITWPGLFAYLGLATLLYSFLDPNFPGKNAAETFGTTLFGIAVGTALSQVPGELYVRRKYGQGGKVRVALWTLGLAAACVLITRLTAVEPGYVYGIIGGFTFAAVLNADDKGRMVFRGVSILLAAGFVAWFVRVPFQAGGSVTGDGAAVVDKLLGRMFVSAVEACAIGLIPLRYLEGEELFSWNRARWAVLWALSLLLFAHVILYPVSSFEPNPSATGLWTIGITVVVYSTLAVGFWAFFHRRETRRRRRSKPVAGAAPA
jgi:DNA-binding beta-propeller fold protein YncE